MAETKVVNAGLRSDGELVQAVGSVDFEFNLTGASDQGAEDMNLPQQKSANPFLEYEDIPVDDQAQLSGAEDVYFTVDLIDAAV